MLRSFRLANHRSIAHEQELLLMPARGAGRPVVPVTAVYGANASGKSNLVHGLSFMRSAVMHSFSSWEVEGEVPRHPFRLDPAGRSRPSEYVAELVIEGVPYVYGFVLDDQEIREEWLYSYPEKRRRTIFSREGGKVSFGTTVGEARAKLEVLEEFVRPNCLFLSAAARLNVEWLALVYGWFHSGLRIRRGDSFLPNLARRVERFLDRNPENRGRLVSLMAAADVGITDVRVEKPVDSLARGDESEPVDLRRPELKFLHGVDDEPFDLREESAGTRSWLELLPTVLEALDGGEVVVVDEIDTSLHPLLTAQLVGLFQDPETNDKNAQLIFTTHDTSLLGTMIGDQALDRDQVWFVQKNSAGASELYPLTDFKPRNDQNIERRYLGGSYGAVPVLDDETSPKLSGTDDQA